MISASRSSLQQLRKLSVLVSKMQAMNTSISTVYKHPFIEPEERVSNGILATDCWSDKVLWRDNVTSQIIPDYKKFPDGINGTATKVHAMGLKMGIYSDAGTKTCAGYPGSLYYEDVDAATFAQWGIDCKLHYHMHNNCKLID